MPPLTTATPLGGREFTPVELYDIPDAVLPREPRIGGGCVAVPEDRLAALARSGPAVLGLTPGFPHVDGFIASLLKELRALVRLPDGHDCLLVPAPPRTVSRLLAREKWAVHHDAVPRPVGDADLTNSAPDSGRWSAADLSGTTWPLAGNALEGLDVAAFDPGPLLGVVPGTTVLALSPRAAAAARAGEDGGPFGLKDLLAPDPDTPRPTASDLMMLAHGVRTLAESHPEHLDAEVESGLDLVREHTTGRSWLAAPAHRPGRDLACVLPTTLAPGAVADLVGFLESRALAYGLADPERPTALRVHLGRTRTDDDLVRLIGLLDVLLKENR
ncbi:hypothetical protein ACYBSK_22410 [Streptomyces sp. BYX5S]